MKTRKHQSSLARCSESFQRKETALEEQFAILLAPSVLAAAAGSGAQTQSGFQLNLYSSGERQRAASLTRYNRLIIDQSKETNVLQNPGLLACQQVGKERGKDIKAERSCLDGGGGQTVWEENGTEKKAD